MKKHIQHRYYSRNIEGKHCANNMWILIMQPEMYCNDSIQNNNKCKSDKVHLDWSDLSDRAVNLK